MLLFVTQQRKDDILLEMKTKPPWQKILLMFMLVFTAEYSVPDEEASSKEQRDGIRPNKAGDFLSD